MSQAAPGGSLLPGEELRELSRPSAVRSWLAIALDWALIAAIFWAAARWPYWWLYPLALALMARQQLALAILMHDAAHGRLFESRPLNDRVAQLFCAGPVFLPLYTYKRGHLRHHQDPLTPGDPDIIMIGGYPAPKALLARKLLQDLSGLSYYKFLKFFSYMAKRERRRGKGGDGRAAGETMTRGFVRASIVLSNGLLFAALAASGHPWLYLLLWTVPSMTVLQAYLRVRGLAEHAGYRPGPDQARNARTVINPAQTFFVAPHHVNFHIEHHLYPSVPFFRLPALHAALRRRGAIPEENLFRGYGPVLRSIVY